MKGANPQVTAFMDWSDEELIALGELCVNYSGVATLYEGVDVIQNEYFIERQSYDFCGGSFIQSSRVTTSRPYSWATAIIEIANTISGVLLSIEQLVQCLPIYEESVGCYVNSCFYMI